MNYQPTVNEITENLEGKLARYFGCTSKEATREQMYKAAAMTIKDILTAKRGEYKKQVNEEGGKRVYYMCMEFLLGRSLKTNLCNLGLSDEYISAPRIDNLQCAFSSVAALTESEKSEYRKTYIPSSGFCVKASDTLPFIDKLSKTFPVLKT